MDQFEKVLQPLAGMHYTLSALQSGEQLLRLNPNLSAQEAKEFFTEITVEDREKVKNWLEKQKARNAREEVFFERVASAIQEVKFPYWIANIEPAAEGERIYYSTGAEVEVEFSFDQWKKSAECFMPQRGSRLSSHQELFVWYALRIANGQWSIDYVVNDSSRGGNYWYAPGSSGYLESAGKRVCGGFRDGQGNTCKIVTYGDDFAVAGCNYIDDCNCFPVATLFAGDIPQYLLKYATGVVVLTK